MGISLVTESATIDAVTGRIDAVINRFGNRTCSSTSETLMGARDYSEQSSQAQRSVVSTSNNDTNPNGSGAKQVRIVYLNSDYELKTEDILLNGTTPVNTVGTDIRFIEKMHTIKGAAAAGAIKLMTETNGDGSEFCGIGSYTYDSFLCHHYVPAGKTCYVIGWGADVDDEVNLKLMGRSWYGDNIVDEHWDLTKLAGIASPPGRLAFYRGNIKNMIASEKTYVRITVAPLQSTSTVIRSYLTLWEP